MDSTQVIQHGTSKSGRWLRARRNRLAFWIAAAEAVVVAVFHGASTWTVMLVGVIAVAVYWFWGRSSRSDLTRQTTWILAVSQTLAFVAAILAVFIQTFALIIAAIFAAVALFILFTERR
jgi:1,4-dihydroxy-2-naphthoate octaprenyltransferase